MAGQPRSGADRSGHHACSDSMNCRGISPSRAIMKSRPITATMAVFAALTRRKKKTMPTTQPKRAPNQGHAWPSRIAQP